MRGRRAACGAARKLSATLTCWPRRRTQASIEFFTRQPGVASVSAQGETKASVVLEGGIQAICGW